MADTRQGVSWHLEFACPFRQGAAVDEFTAAINATQKLRSIDDAAKSNDLFGDLCVRGVSYQAGTKSPARGFSISEAVAPAGGLEAARQLCGSCPANANPVGASGRSSMAGCCDWLGIDPDRRSIDQQLREAITNQGLQGRFEAAFPRTDPLGYGPWISSPLTREQAEILSVVIPTMIDKGDGEPPTTLDPEAILFRQACAISSQHGIRLHVQMSPPGHTDFGFYTIFPHCPRCKQSSGERWENEFPTTPKACPTCGHTYVPAETGSRTEMKDDHETNDLRKRLTPEQYSLLREEWLARHADDPKNWLDDLLLGGDREEESP